MKSIKAKITISRWRSFGNSEPKTGVTLTLMDDKSGNGICKVEMSTAEFSEVLFGDSHKDCDAEVYNTYENLGKFPIRKAIWTEWESYSRNNTYLTAAAKAASKPFEVDGWEYCSHQLGNGHYAQRNESGKMAEYPVYLVKYVDTLEEQEKYIQEQKEINESKISKPLARNRPRKSARKSDVD